MALEGKGFIADSVLVVETEYGTLVTNTPTATTLPMVSETLSKQFDEILDDRTTGQGAAKNKSEQGNQTVDGNTVIDMDYQNILPVLTQAIGVSSGDGKETTPYIIEPDEEITTSKSLILDKTAIRQRYLGGMIQQFNIGSSASPPNKVTADIGWSFQSMNTDATAIIDKSLTAGNRMKHSELVFRIGDQSDALTSGDELKVTDVTIALNNNIRMDFSSNGAVIIQPIRNMAREVLLTFTASRFNSDATIVAIRTAVDAHTPLQVDLIWTKSATEIFMIELPELIVTDRPMASIPGPDALSYTTTLRAYINTSAIMASVNHEFLATLTTAADA